MILRRAVVIRQGEELWVLPEALTVDEREEVAERQRSPEARRRFGVRLREARRIEDKPLKDALKAALESEPGRGSTPRKKRSSEKS
jgi:hypothetical protein